MEKINELNNVRKLATFAIIRDIQPIEGADNIEIVKVRGWQCVAKKGEFQIGDWCVYVEVDSIMPDGLTETETENWKVLNKQMAKAKDEEERDILRGLMEEITMNNTRPEFEFLRGIKFHIKTRKILGELSQGICFPLSILNKFGRFQSTIGDVDYTALFMTHDGIGIPTVENEDLTALLGIVQYEAPDPAIMGGDAAGTLQAVGLLISDEERLENLSSKYDKLRMFKYYKTEKLEGTSFTCYLKGANYGEGGKFGVCGRTVDFKVPEEDAGYDQMNSYWKVAIKLDLENKMRIIAQRLGISGDFALQGELIGEGIQKNIYNIKGQTVRFYNAYDISRQEYFLYYIFLTMLNEVGLDSVPILAENYELPENANDILNEVDTTVTVIPNSSHLVEGFVFVASGHVQNLKITRANFGRLSFKAKSREYKL